AVLQALGDKLAARRAAAAVALRRSGGAAQRSAVHRLLEDSEAQVRLRVALALVEARDRDAVKPLIGVLGDLPPEQLGRAEDVLRSLAGDKAPDVGAGKDEAGRRKCRDEWLAWWDRHGAGIDLARLDTPQGPLDAGTVP